MPLTSQELTAWATGTATELGPVDFQDMRDTSRLYVSTWRQHDTTSISPPWQPDMTDEEIAEAAKAEERFFDMLMGVG